MNKHNLLVINAVDELEAYQKAFVALYNDANVPSDPELLREASLGLTITGKLPQKRIIWEKNTFKLNYDYSIFNPSWNKLALEEINYWSIELFDKNVNYELVNYLRKFPFSKRAIINRWRPEYLDLSRVATCEVYFYHRINNNQLNLNMHFRANDSYNNLLIDLDIIRCYHKYLSDKLGLRLGSYIHFVDSFHFRRSYSSKIKQLYNQFNL